MPGTFTLFDGCSWSLQGSRSCWRFHHISDFPTDGLQNATLSQPISFSTGLLFNSLCSSNMSLSSAQRALSIYGIVELVLSHISTDCRFPNALLVLQRTCTTWHAVISRSFLLRGILRLRLPTISDPYLPSLPAHHPQLLWVYDHASDKFPRLYSSATGSKDLFCKGKASFLDMLLVAPSAPLTVCWFSYQYHNSLREIIGERGIHKTIRDVLEAASAYVQKEEMLGFADPSSEVYLSLSLQEPSSLQPLQLRVYMIKASPGLGGEVIY